MGGRPPPLALLALARPVPLALSRIATRGDEIEDVRELLLDHADPAVATKAELAAMAQTVAVACLGDDHLWQDLQLPDRAALGALMTQFFPTLAARNDRDMKWKKFLYKQLCERAEIQICKAPSCAVCTDHAICFGPET